MTKQQQKADNLRDHIAEEVGSSTMDLIDELINLTKQIHG